MAARFSNITRREAVLLAGSAFIFPGTLASADEAAILVYKDPDCGCCGRWVEHLKAAGFVVTVKEASDLHVVRQRLGVPDDLAACHTAQVRGYVVEGHVPAIAVRRLLEERPTAVGLAVPGMPAGSPGMEGRTPGAYDVMLFGADGQRPFMRFIGSQNIG